MTDEEKEYNKKGNNFAKEAEKKLNGNSLMSLFAGKEFKVKEAILLYEEAIVSMSSCYGMQQFPDRERERSGGNICENAILSRC